MNHEDIGHTVTIPMTTYNKLKKDSENYKELWVEKQLAKGKTPERRNVDGESVAPSIAITLSRAESPKVEPQKLSYEAQKLEDAYQSSVYAENVVGLMNGSINQAIVVEGENSVPTVVPNESCIVRIDKFNKLAYIAEWQLLDMWSCDDKDLAKRDYIFKLLKDYGYCLGFEKVSLLAGTPFENGKIMCWVFDLTKL